MEKLEEWALRFHMEALVVDTHCDTLQCFFSGRGSPPITPLRVDSGLGGRSDKGHLDIPRMWREESTVKSLPFSRPLSPILRDP
jgi:hypothetical protein